MEKSQLSVIDKINVKSVSLGITFLLLGAGVYMCLRGIAHDGFIDIKSVALTGRLQTGSLGLIVIFLGVAIVLAVIKKSGIFSEKKGEKIEIEVGEKRIICENLSFRKVQEIRELIKDTDVNESAEKNISNE